MRLHTLITCVNYADFLRLTLPHNRHVLDNILVITAPDDTETQRVCEELGVGNLVTDCWQLGGASFNKARALDLALDKVALAPDDWALALDADILLPNDLLEHLGDLDPTCLYSVWRRMCRSKQDWCNVCQNGRVDHLPLDFAPVINGRVWGHRPTANSAGLHGYFQLWNAGSQYQRFGSFPTAAEYDVYFALQWQEHERHYISGVEAVHLGESLRNWEGRVTQGWQAANPYPAGQVFLNGNQAGTKHSNNKRSRLPRVIDHQKTNARAHDTYTVTSARQCKFGTDEGGEQRCLHPQVRCAGGIVTPEICRACRFAEFELNGHQTPTTAGSDNDGLRVINHRTVQTWAVGVTSAPRRRTTLRETLASIHDAGWDSVRLFVEPSTDIPAEYDDLQVSARDEVLGAFPNWYLSLTELVLRQPHADAFLLFQDDILVAKHARDYLERQLWPSPQLGVVSLYCPSHYGEAGEVGFLEENRGWDTWGAMALVFPNRSARALLSDPIVLEHRGSGANDGLKNIDSVVGSWCQRNALPYFVHHPSLAQHIGATSTLYPGANTRGRREAKEMITDAREVTPRSVRPDRRSKKRIHIKPTCGLCNRMMALASSMAMAELWDTDWAFYWEYETSCPAEFGDLFQPLGNPLSVWRPLGDEGDFYHGYSWPYDFWRRIPKLQDSVSEEEFVALTVKHANRLQPIPAIEARVDQIITGDSADWLGVHVRRTDLEYEGRNGIRSDFQVSEDERYFGEMEAALEQNSSLRFFLATDNPDTQARYRDHFGERVHVAVTEFSEAVAVGGLRLDQSRLTSMEDAVVDLYCLSRCGRILGTAGSSFSVMASWIGGREVRQI